MNYEKRIRDACAIKSSLPVPTIIKLTSAVFISYFQYSAVLLGQYQKKCYHHLDVKYKT